MGSTSVVNSGILSGVFNFVSREFESFIANATGSEPSTSQVLLDDSINSDFSREASPVEGDVPILRNFSHKSDQPLSEPSAKNAPEVQDALKKRIKKVVASAEKDDLLSKCSRRSPKLQLSRSLKRKSSLSMPGSLFPRSPSMDPDADPSSAEKEQRVRFALHIAQTSDPHSPQRQKSPSSRGSSSTSCSPRRRSQIVSSVKTAVDKFHIGEEDADPSILLPSPKRSPHALVASRNLQSRRISSPSSPSAISTKLQSKNYSVEAFSDDCGDTRFLRGKGKEKESAARQQLYEDGHHDNEAPALSVEQAEYDLNGDKIRIKMLEEEIERLKQELSKRPVPTPLGLEKVFPPPPPPPPLPQVLPKKILLDILAATPESRLFASARASLKQAPAPVENPINPLLGRRAGQPTVGLAADKMAAFLNEMKTVRLRKVSERSSEQNPAPPPFEPFNAQSTLRKSLSLQRSQPGISLSKSIRASKIANSALSGSEIHMGEKRKRNTNNIHDDADPAPKRRLYISSTDSSLATGSNLDSHSSFSMEGTASSSHSYPPHSRAITVGGTWQSGSFADAPTPSLCSDNDVEREDISLDDQPPSTPPAMGPSRNVYRFKGNGIPVEHEFRKQIDVGMDKPSDNPQSGRNFKSSFLEVGQQRPKPNIFDKRLPSSPFPNKSPRRPRPPNRTSRPTPQLVSLSRQEDHSEEEDPLSLSFSFPDDTFPSADQRQTTSQPSTRPRDAHSLSPSSGSFSGARRRSASQVSRRRTLDEELRDIPFNEELEDEAIFTGVGTKSKEQGFLAHGGAGGVPVFMGIGYVEGAKGDDSYATYTDVDADVEYLPLYSTSRNRRR